MKRVRLLVLLLALAGGGSYVALQAFTITPMVPARAPAERFPIVSRFELPQPYGYFIGDEIPVDLVIETSDGVVIDLINLPQPGGALGPFEVRALRLTSATLPQGATVYRAAYTLQYFGPTPFAAVFGPLEILYAFPPAPAAPARTYTYKRLLTQPAVIHLARFGPRHGTAPPARIKGFVDDTRTEWVWSLSIVGAACVLIATGGWGWGRFAAWQQHRYGDTPPCTSTGQALQTLQHEAAVFFRIPTDVNSPVGARLEHILRDYVQTVYGVPAFTLTASELATRLNGASQASDILCLLEECETLKYQAAPVSPGVERELWWKTIGLFEKLQGESAP